MRARVRYAAAAAAVSLLLLWLFCLPRNLFGNSLYSTVVTGREGELLGARTADDGQWRFPECDSLPDKFAKALVEFEDRQFYRHCGVSVRALGRAVVQNVRNGRIVSGGSTITMQVIRLSRQKPRTLWEKLVEMFMATRLEMRCSKEEILRLYASHAPFGGNVVGIDAAMWRYLGNDAVELSWAEAATLAILQNAPSAMHLEKNRDRLLAKRDRLLKRLNEKGDIGNNDYELAVEEPLIGAPHPMPQFAPHLVEHCHRNARGLRSATHIDLGLQQRVEESLAQWSRELRLMGVNDLSAVVVEVRSGEVIAYCGNSDMQFNREGMWVDIARSPRSSGSILKPLLYAAALESGTVLPQSLLPDLPTDFGGFAPKNFDGSFAGAVGADKALTLSLNVPNVHLLKEFGIMSFVETLRQCGLTSISRPAGEYGLSLVLGGAEVTLLDVVSCYAEMAACYQGSSRCEGFPIRDRVALYDTFEAMRELNRPDQMDWRRVSSAQNLAWKTGTSYGSRDAWAVGLTPEYAIGVWVGNADGSGVSGLTGARTAGPIMFGLSELLPQCGWFSSPEDGDGVELAVCSHSGHIAGPYCDRTTKMLLPRASVRSQVCPYCREVAVPQDGPQILADRRGAVQMRHFFVLSPDMEHFYKPRHPEYQTLYSVKTDSGTTRSDAMRFMYPSDGSVISLARQLDGSAGSLVCKVAHTEPSAELFWHLDNSYLGSTVDFHQMRISPSEGYHTITVVDSSGAEISVGIAVKCL